MWGGTTRPVTGRLPCLVAALALLPLGTAHAATIVIYGASGNIGSDIVNEALARGHRVIGVSRTPASLGTRNPRFSVVAGDASNLDSMLGTIRGADAVVLSVRGYGPNNFPEESLDYVAAKTFIAASRRFGNEAPRVIQLGGGSTLYTRGVLGLDARPATEGTSQHGLVWGHWLALQSYRATTSVKWTVICPSGGYDADGPRVGEFRLGTDEVLVDGNGRPGGISHRDLAVAVVDEIERPQFIRRRMTVGY